MKNIYLLPTDKPSRLYKNLLTDKLFILENSFMDICECNREYQNIYITSDEEIKIGDWYYLPRTNLVYKCKEDPTELNLERRLGVAKIILTTDLQLIQDGVQAIDDEFLEWFVKNPSCEYVEVEEDIHIEFEEVSYEGDYQDVEYIDYKIIIPKEEPKILFKNEHFSIDEDCRVSVFGTANFEEIAFKLKELFPDNVEIKKSGLNTKIVLYIDLTLKNK